MLLTKVLPDSSFLLVGRYLLLESVDLLFEFRYDVGILGHVVRNAGRVRFDLRDEGRNHRDDCKRVII